MSPRGTPEKPFYQAVKQVKESATPLYMIICDEGWRESIVCCDMFKWAADWLVEVLQGQPFAPGRAP